MQNHYIITADSVDDLMHKTFKTLRKEGENVSASRGAKKTIREIIDAKLVLKNPLARLSISESRSTPFSAFGEFLWYYSGRRDLEFIEYYIRRYKNWSDDGETIYDAYGPRIKGEDDFPNQLMNIINLLKRRRNSKKAVIQIYSGEDLDKHINLSVKNIPCTLGFQFLIRDDELTMIVNMRSNDVIWGLPHDLFSFTMFQEIVAREVGCELGEYVHNVGSLHYYTDTGIEERINDYLHEGYQDSESCIMPKMPEAALSQLDKIIIIEDDFRQGNEVNIAKYKLNDYWKDVAILLQCYSLKKMDKNQKLLAEAKKFTHKIYKDYTDKLTLNIRNEIKK